MSWSISPAPPAVGPVVLAVTLADAGGRPVRGARLRVHADMAHPGMRPVLAEADEKESGRYEARLDLTMAGSWVVSVSGDLPDGRKLARHVAIDDVRPAPAP